VQNAIKDEVTDFMPDMCTAHFCLLDETIDKIKSSEIKDIAKIKVAQFFSFFGGRGEHRVLYHTN